MIYLTGDLHGSIDRLTERYFPESHMLTEKDYLIQLGDFGCFWKNPPSKDERECLDFFSQQRYTTLFIDGNHENFPLIYSYPVVDFCGGKAHKINDRLYHLIRGNIYNIDGKSFFAFGGALSIDKKYRIPDISWWSEEYPTQEEMNFAYNNLESVNFSVDYVLTHAAPLSIVEWMTEHGVFDNGCRGEKANDSVSKFLEFLLPKMSFKHWFFAHYHTNFSIKDKFTLLYTGILNLNKVGEFDARYF